MHQQRIQREKYRILKIWECKMKKNQDSKKNRTFFGDWNSYSQLAFFGEDSSVALKKIHNTTQRLTWRKFCSLTFIITPKIENPNQYTPKSDTPRERQNRFDLRRNRQLDRNQQHQESNIKTLPIEKIQNPINKHKYVPNFQSNYLSKKSFFYFSHQPLYFTYTLLLLKLLFGLFSRTPL